MAGEGGEDVRRRAAGGAPGDREDPPHQRVQRRRVGGRDPRRGEAAPVVGVEHRHIIANPSMRYLVRTFLGMTLFAFCWVAVGYGIFQLLQVGTCASGGPYVSARECPDGIGGLIFALIGGHHPALRRRRDLHRAAARRPAPIASRRTRRVVIWFWTGLFWALAVGCFLAVWGPEANPGPGGETGGLIVGFMGLIMGAGGLLALKFGAPQEAAVRRRSTRRWCRWRRRRAASPAPPTRRTASRRSTGCASRARSPRPSSRR